MEHDLPTLPNQMLSQQIPGWNFGPSFVFLLGFVNCCVSFCLYSNHGVVSLFSTIEFECPFDISSIRICWVFVEISELKPVRCSIRFIFFLFFKDFLFFNSEAKALRYYIQSRYNFHFSYDTNFITKRLILVLVKYWKFQ